MKGRVHQLLSAAGPYDAITNQALAYRRLFSAWGLEGGVYASNRDPAMDGAVERADRLRRRLEDPDLLLVHYSAHTRELEWALERPRRKLLAYHNVTPPHYLWDYEPYVALACALGRERLRKLAGRIDVAVTASEFSARDLREAGFADVRVIQQLYMFDRARLDAGAGGADRWRDGKRNLLFVGRLSANKRQDRLIKAFALYQRYREPNSRLILVGSPANGVYQAYLRKLTDQVGARDVVIAGGLSQPELNGAYASASAFVCLSEHEGFCIPLLEALHFGLPIVALKRAAVPEVVGDAAVLLDQADLPTVAEAIAMCVEDVALGDELRRRGARRLELFSPGRTAAAWRETVEDCLR